MTCPTMVAVLMLCVALEAAVLGAEVQKVKAEDAVPTLSEPLIYLNVSTHVMTTLNMKSNEPQWSTSGWAAALADELNIEVTRLEAARIRGGPQEARFGIMNRMVEYTSPQVQQVLRDKPLYATVHLSGVMSVTRRGLRDIAEKTAQDLSLMYDVSLQTVHTICTAEPEGVRVRYSVDVRGHSSPQDATDAHAAYLTEDLYVTTSMQEGMLQALGGSDTLVLLHNESTHSTITIQGLALGSLSPLEIELLSREAAEAIKAALGTESVFTTLRAGSLGCIVEFSVGDTLAQDEVAKLIDSKLGDVDVGGVQAVWDRMTRVMLSHVEGSTVLLCRGVGCSVGSVPPVVGGIGWYAFPTMQYISQSVEALENSLLLDISDKYDVPASAVSVQLHDASPVQAVYAIASTDPQVQANADTVFNNGDIFLSLLAQAYASLQVDGTVAVDKARSRQPELTDRSYVLVEPVSMDTFNAALFESSVITALGLGDCEDIDNLFSVNSYGDTPFFLVSVNDCYRPETETSLLALRFTEGAPSAVDLRSAVLSSSICCKDVCHMAIFCSNLGIIDTSLAHLACSTLNSTLHCAARSGCAWDEGLCVEASSQAPTPPNTLAPPTVTDPPTTSPSTPQAEESDDFSWLLIVQIGLGALALCLVLLILVVCLKRRKGRSITEAREDPKEVPPLTPAKPQVHDLPKLQAHPVVGTPVRPENIYPSPPNKVPFYLPPPPVSGTEKGDAMPVGVGSYYVHEQEHKYSPTGPPQTLLKALPYSPGGLGPLDFKDVLPALSEVNPLKGYNPMQAPDLAGAGRHEEAPPVWSTATPQRATARDEFDMSV